LDVALRIQELCIEFLKKQNPDPGSQSADSGSSDGNPDPGSQSADSGSSDGNPGPDNQSTDSGSSEGNPESGSQSADSGSSEGNPESGSQSQESGSSEGNPESGSQSADSGSSEGNPESGSQSADSGSSEGNPESGSQSQKSGSSEGNPESGSQSQESGIADQLNDTSSKYVKDFDTGLLSDCIEKLAAKGINQANAVTLMEAHDGEVDSYRPLNQLDVDSITGRLTNVLIKKLQSYTSEHTSYHKRGARIQGRRLVSAAISPTALPFRKREQNGFRAEASVGILVDRSGSMYGPEIRIAMAAAAAIAEVEKRIPGLAVSVWAFPSMSAAPYAVDVLKTEKMSIEHARQRFTLDALGSTPLKEALQRACFDMKTKTKHRRKVLLVLCDGVPDDPIYREVDEAKEMGIELYGIGIRSPRLVQHIPGSIIVRQLDELPNVMVQVLEKSLIR
jgi:hypothetical protein